MALGSVDILPLPYLSHSKVAAKERTCPACGHLSKDNRLTQAQFLCVDCGDENNADVVGAINVLARGHRVLACGEPVQPVRSVKQGPPK